jgi:hypothetical protein
MRVTRPLNGTGGETPTGEPAGAGQDLKRDMSPKRSGPRATCRRRPPLALHQAVQLLRVQPGLREQLLARHRAGKRVPVLALGLLGGQQRDRPLKPLPRLLRRIYRPKTGRFTGKFT